MTAPILIADKFEPTGVDGLKALGSDVVYQPELQDQALADALASGGAAVLVVRSTRVTASMLTPALQLIVRAGAGVNTIDVAAATARGILVANCPGRNATAVAELAFGLMLALDRRIPDNVADLRAGTWNKKEYSKARGLFGRTLGLLGAGSIACEMIRRGAAFGMPVVLWSRRFAGADRPLEAGERRRMGLADLPDGTPVDVAPSPEAVAERADVLSVHLALGPDTRQFVGANVLGRLRPGSFFINTSRGELVDHDALRAAIHARQIRAGLDVFAVEPSATTGPFTDPIVREPGVYGTHHIGASTEQAQDAIAAETVRIVKSFIETGRAPNAVNDPA